MRTDQDTQLTTEQMLANLEVAKRGGNEAGETTAEAMLRSIETAKRLMKNAARERSTKLDGYIGHVVV
jgi:hypothetical protein